MRISDYLLNVIISELRIEYNGTHNSDPKSPLWGRCAYWRIYLGDTYINKITAPVKSINPKQATLNRLLKLELKKRINAIEESLECSHYGEIVKVFCDPYSIMPLIKAFEGRYFKSYEPVNLLPKHKSLKERLNV